MNKLAWADVNCTEPECGVCVHSGQRKIFNIPIVGLRPQHVPSFEGESGGGVEQFMNKPEVKIVLLAL